MQVGLAASPYSSSIRPLLSSILRAAGLELVRAEDTNHGNLDGIIEVTNPSQVPPPGGHACPSFRFEVTVGDEEASTVVFSSSNRVPRLLRGRTVVTRAVSGFPEGPPVGEVLAAAGTVALWTSLTQGGQRHDWCRLTQSVSQAGMCVFNHLNGKRFMGLLPLIEWARSISGWQRWNRPPTRACFMFDDPNLHSSTYGFVSFMELAGEGRRHGFHTSMATVPLDQYYVNRAAAAVFRQNPDVLSFLVHGNNHTHRELAGPEPSDLKLAMMRQALLRIERCERKAGVKVARVMAPPHGACSAGMMRALAQAGFEAACISHGSVQAANPTCGWAAGLGADPAMVIEGLPVIPRFRLGHGTENQVLLSAYLDQPIIAVGHHWDLEGGVAPLVETATAIRALGDVDWLDMATIARGNYHWRIERAGLHVRSFSRKVRLNVPEGVGSVTIEYASVDGSNAIVACRTARDGRVIEPVGSENGVWSFAVPESCLLDVTAGPDAGSEPAAVAAARTPLHAPVRRGLTEVRDRLMPYMPRRRAVRNRG